MRYILVATKVNPPTNRLVKAYDSGLTISTSREQAILRAQHCIDLLKDEHPGIWQVVLFQQESEVGMSGTVVWAVRVELPGYEHLIPGTPTWMKYWQDHPEQQSGMLALQKRLEARQQIGGGP